MRGRPRAIAVVLAAGCQREDEIEWVRFNDPLDAFEIQVGAEAPDVSQGLLSNLGLTDVGTATASPGGGPVGTQHAIVVSVDDAWELQVTRASLLIDSPGRGVTEIEMEHDLADPGVWAVQITSLGRAAEERVDVVTVALWQDLEAPLVPSDTAAED